eukprot:scaffold22406_cov58-Phaeocystis_antarctica.AAC.3
MHHVVGGQLVQTPPAHRPLSQHLGRHAAPSWRVRHLGKLLEPSHLRFPCAACAARRGRPLLRAGRQRHLSIEAGDAMARLEARATSLQLCGANALLLLLLRRPAPPQHSSSSKPAAAAASPVKGASPIAPSTPPLPSTPGGGWGGGSGNTAGGGEGTGRTTTRVLAGSADMTETSNAADAATVSTARQLTASATAVASAAVGDSMIAVTETDAAATTSLMRAGSMPRMEASRSTYACWSKDSIVPPSVARKRTRRTRAVLGKSGGKGGGGDGCGGTGNEGDGEASGVADGSGGDGGREGGACVTRAVTCGWYAKAAEPPAAAQRAYSPPVTEAAPSSTPPLSVPSRGVRAFAQPWSAAGTKRTWSPCSSWWLPLKPTSYATSESSQA